MIGSEAFTLFSVLTRADVLGHLLARLVGTLPWICGGSAPGGVVLAGRHPMLRLAPSPARVTVIVQLAPPWGSPVRRPGVVDHLVNQP